MHQIAYGIAKRPDPAFDCDVADSYRQLRQQLKHAFVLPREAGYLAPVLEACTDLDRFRLFVRYVRDIAAEIHGDQSQQYIDMQVFLRKLDVRAAQRRRRQRSKAALRWARKHMPERSADERQLWLAKVEDEWIAERQLLLAEAKVRKGDRITVDEKADLVAQFWSDLDTRIEQGDLPGWEDVFGS